MSTETQEVVTTQIKRPDRFSEQNCRKVAEGVLQKCIEWLEEAGEGSDQEEVLEQLTSAIYRSYDKDGYGIAKYLDDNYYWEPDAQLVDILDGLNFHSVHSAALKEWVQQNGIKVGYKQGDRVVVKLFNETEVGVVTNVNHEEATCTLWVPSRWAESVLDTMIKSKSGTIIGVEKLTPFIQETSNEKAQ